MISVVMPAHNEEAFLANAVAEVVGEMRSRPGDFEIVVVENGSTDRTVEVAGKLAVDFHEVRALSRPVADYGGALRAGFLEAAGDLVAIFDVDYYDFGFLDRALALMNAGGGPDVVVGSKRGSGAVDTRGWPRRLVTAVFTTVLRYGFGLKVADTHGVKVLRRAPLRDLAAQCRYGTDIYDTELILRAERAGLSVTSVPVTVEERRPSRSSIARRIPRTLLALARLRFALWNEERRARGADAPL
ncbi:MAG: glycosyltransferase family 2 protein [Actinomycetota bacterium]|jgi:glycosyltransferase AglD